MSGKVQIIIFSYNRAMQLECLLNSIVEYCKSINYEISVIYHTTELHKRSYEILISEYNRENIQFFERSPLKNRIIRILPLFAYWRNLYRFIKYPYLRKIDNFKYLLESVIEESESELLMFCTDDTYIDHTVTIAPEILAKIRSNPSTVSYRLCLGQNIKNDYPEKLTVKDDLICWNSAEYSPEVIWNYNFLVDGIIYDKKTILRVLKRILYHMPSSLESFINTYVASRKLFSEGYCPKESILLNVWLNRVQKIGYHHSANVDVNQLREWFEEGFRLKYNYKKPVVDWGFIPASIIVSRGEEKIEISLNEKRDADI